MTEHSGAGAIRGRLRPLATAGMWASLMKAPLTLMASYPAVTVYLLTVEAFSPLLLLVFVAGVVLAGSGAAAFNQCWERDFDARMERTRSRPLPSGALSIRAALTAAGLFTVVGCGLLLLFFPWSAAALAFFTVVWYVGAYTPLKRITVWCTEVGAVCGAVPPLVGAAATGSLGEPIGWLVAAILGVWQVPHFHPIAWRHREDYRRGGFRMLAAEEGPGWRAGNRSLAYALVLFGVGLTPLWAGAGALYGFTAIAAGALFVYLTWRFRKPADRDASARRLFRFSLIHIALLLSMLVIDHWLGGRL